MNAKVLLGPSSFAEADKSPLDKLRAAGYAVVDNPYKRKLTKKELMQLLTPEVIGVIAGLEPLDREVLSNSRLKVVSRVGAGISNVDLGAAKELGIAVCSTPDGPTTAVAELTLGALLSLLRMIPAMDQALHRGEWSKKIGTQLEGKTAVVVGYGRIGRRVAELLTAFKAKVLVVDPNLPEDSSYAYPRLRIEQALPQADIIALHCSGEDCLLGPREFDLMKKGTLILNAARGGVVAEGSLVKALKEGTVAGAWLDTFETEPYAGELRNFPNVVLTPHVGSYTAECRKQMESAAVDNLLAVLRRA